MPDSNTETVLKRYSRDPGELTSEAVPTAVAAVEGCSPLELDPLASVVDPDAVDSLLSETDESTRVCFHYVGYEIQSTPAEILVVE